jgi:hypothetical protein
MSTARWYRDVAGVLDELGISYEFEQGRKHTKVWIRKGEKKGILVISVSPSDHRALKEVKKTAKKLVW